MHDHAADNANIDRARRRAGCHRRHAWDVGGAVLLGGASTITAFLISGYWAMGLGAVGLPLSFAARSRSHATGRTGLATTAVVLNILGLALGLSAQLMQVFVMSRS